MPTSPATRRYIKRFVPAMTGYVLCLFGAKHMLAQPHSGLALAAIAILPALPLLVVIAAMGLYVVEERDEYIRALFVRHIIIATGLLLAVTTAWGFLEDAGAVGHVPFYWTFILWCIALGGAQMTDWAIRRLRGDGQ